jgi:hypothetical protein
LGILRKRKMKMGKVPFNARRSDCLWIDPDELLLITDKSHPLYDERVEEPVDEKLKANILYKMQGVLEPVIICRINGDPAIVDGRRRTKAARAANQELREQGAEPIQIPCMLKRGDGNDLFGMSIAMNEQRRDDTASAKSAKLIRLLNQGHSHEDAAKVFGVSVTTIRRWEKIGDRGAETAPKERKRGPRTKAEIRSAIGMVREWAASSVGFTLRPDKEVVENVLRWVLRETDSLFPEGGDNETGKQDSNDSED